ncbi:MAG TPA: type II toxin-antitoxin system RelE/ParE family toxin [Xanthobacteraceae bacterium]|nr:type II toxin-antitoxin system RelE/ParE family toxin [Xanthobacteraceae bacterium]
MALEVYFRPRAEADLIGLHQYVAERSGPIIAGGYIERIEAACMALAEFPNRGTRRDDLSRGLRTIGFERRVTIAFRVLRTRVEIVTIAYGGRDFASDVSND